MVGSDSSSARNNSTLFSMASQYTKIRKRKSFLRILDDSFVFFCGACGTACLVVAAVHFCIYPTNPAIVVFAVDTTCGIAGILSLLHALRCCRQRCLSPGFFLGYGTFLAGLALGLYGVRLWNTSATNYVKEQYGPGVTAAVEQAPSDDTKIQPLSSSSDNPVIETYLLIGCSAAVICISICHYGYRSLRACWLCCNDPISSCPKKGKFCSFRSSCFIRSLFSLTAIAALCFHAAAAIFLSWPFLKTHGWIHGHLVAAPPRQGHEQALMVSFIVVGALAIWMCLSSRPRQHSGSCYRTVVLVIVLVCHLAMVICSTVDLELPQSWKIEPQQFTQCLFTLSSLLLLAVLLLHSIARARSFTAGIPPPPSARTPHPDGLSNRNATAAADGCHCGSFCRSCTRHPGTFRGSTKLEVGDLEDETPHEYDGTRSGQISTRSVYAPPMRTAYFTYHNDVGATPPFSQQFLRPSPQPSSNYEPGPAPYPISPLIRPVPPVW